MKAPSPPTLPRRLPRRLTSDLLAWYDREHRGLPWRTSSSPYGVWISEIMLQQTRVDTVIPYYQRFLAAFPDVEALAAADLQDVLRHWEGLGYYARARNMHRAAGHFRSAGAMPKTSRELRMAPGIGEYTAAAIASICHKEVVPVIDGNVLRVCARFLGIGTPLTQAATRKRIRAFLESAIDASRPGDFNQAMMELGALVCKPQEPRCPACPWRRACVARRTEKTDQFPARKEKGPLPTKIVAVGLVTHGKRLLVARRPHDRMLGGLWELPGGSVRPGEDEAESLTRVVLKETGIPIRILRPAGNAFQAYSHFAVNLHAYWCRPAFKGEFRRPAPPAAWVSVRELETYPFGKAARALLQLLDGRRPGRA